MAYVPEAGLCEDCEHGRCVRSARGSTFWLCGLHERDRRLPKYPRLPVLACTGYVRRSAMDEPKETP
jgi:hypothetical protein